MWEKVISACIKDSGVGFSHILHSAAENIFHWEKSAFEKEGAKIQWVLQQFSVGSQKLVKL